jgi:hypothetical protein
MERLTNTSDPTQADPRPEIRRQAVVRQVVWMTFLAAAAIFLLSVFVPWKGEYPGSDGNLDMSWSMVLQWTYNHHVDFGRDMVFTYGPWGLIQSGYTPQAFWCTVLGWTLMAAAFFAGALKLSRHMIACRWVRGLWLAGTIAFIGDSAMTTHDVRMFSLTCLAMLLYICADDLGMSATTILLALGMALASQVKFSCCLLSLGVMGAISVDQLIRRRRPWVGLIFAFCFLALWELAGQRLSVLPAYFRYELSLSRGYEIGAGTFSPTETSDVAWFLTCAAPILAALAYVIWRNPGRWVRRGILSAGVALFLLVIFKAGNTRHEGHEIVGPVALGMFGLLTAAAVWSRMNHAALKVLAVLAAAAPLALTWCTYERYNNDGLPAELAATVEQFPAHVSAAFGRAGRDQNYRDMLSQIRNVHPLPPVRGTVDFYGWFQSALIANDLDYRPRPVFQSYVTFTPALEKLNADSLEGPRAPDSIFFDVGYMDNHCPSQEDALVWPRILTHYDVKESTSESLLMERSAEARTFSLAPLTSAAAEMGQSVDVPASDDPIWVSIDLQSTLLGKVIETVYKPPVVAFTLQLADGEACRCRLNPETAKAGFLLSPMIWDRYHFAMLEGSQWSAELAGQRVKSIAIEVSGGAKQYRRDYAVTFERLLFPHRDVTTVPGLERLAAFWEFMRRMQVLSSDAPPRWMIADRSGRTVMGVLGSMRSSVPVPTGATSLHIEFGQALAAASPQADGTHFRVGMASYDSAGRLAGKFVWERVLNPHTDPADGGTQQADIELDQPAPAYIILETLPGPNQPNNFAYWGAVEFH